MANDVNIVFSPNVPEDYNNRKRFLVSKNTLDKYITKENANNALQRIKFMQTNKITLKYRKYGKLEIYLK